MKQQYLHEGWQLNYQGKKLVATVPGCVHTDLIHNGIIKDIFWRDNSQNCQWIENLDWEYGCTFDATVGNAASLVFEGLDTYSEIYLNGVKLGETDNMFIPHRFDVSDVLSEKSNTLIVRFRSPVKEVAGHPERKGAFTTERLYTRRMQCTYGWDWVDRFVTCGIYRPVYLEYANGIDVENVYVYTQSIDRFSAQISAEIDFRNFQKGSLAAVEILAPDGSIAAKTEFYANLQSFVRRFDIANPQLWYPNGYGEQPLYRLRVTVGENVFEESFGIRTLKILQLADEPGSEYRKKALEIKHSDVGKIFSHNQETSGFQVIVNGKRIFCQGGNWVPCEPFPSAETDEKIQSLLEMAKKMGVNFLRVWGGGLFEKNSFYNTCDRLGILVAQDFLMACGEYPEKEPWFIDALRAESEFAAKYLRNHPCLAWWHGDNENATWCNECMEDYHSRDSSLLGSEPQIRRFDHSRMFLQSSPYGGNSYGSLTKGTSHITNYISDIFDYFHESDCVDYKEHLAFYTTRFTSEDGTFGAMSRSSMLKCMTEDDLLHDPEEKMIFYHSKNNPDLKRHFLCDIISFTQKVLGSFTDGEDKFFKYKYIQYEWVRVVFENIRRNLGYSNGLLFWMFNDCWPAAMGWSFVDYYGLPKASHYSFKRCAKETVGSIRKERNRYVLNVSTYTEKSEPITARVYAIEKGETVKSYETELHTNGYGYVEEALPWTPAVGELIVCDLEYAGGKDRCFYCDGALPIKPCDEALQVIEKCDDRITVKASAYIHAVEFEGAFVFEDNYFSMMPNEIRTVRFEQTDDSETKTISTKCYTVIME